MYGMAGPFQGMIRHLGAGNTPTWSPDDSQIAYMVAADGNSEPKLLEGTKIGTINRSMEWSPDGSKIIFSSER